MPPRRELPRPPRTIRAARLVDGQICPLSGSHVTPHVKARRELAELWDKLSPQGRKALLTAARLTAQEEGLVPAGTSVIALDEEVA